MQTNRRWNEKRNVKENVVYENKQSRTFIEWDDAYVTREIMPSCARTNNRHENPNSSRNHGIVFNAVIPINFSY